MEASRASVSQDWKSLYEAAVLELNPQRMLQRINEAEYVILKCLEQNRSETPSDAEGEMLLNALNAIRDLRQMSER